MNPISTMTMFLGLLKFTTVYWIYEICGIVEHRLPSKLSYKNTNRVELTPVTDITEAKKEKIPDKNVQLMYHFAPNPISTCPFSAPTRRIQGSSITHLPK